MESSSEGQTQKQIIGAEVAIPEELATRLKDLMSMPPDGINRNPHIRWQGARLAVQSVIESYGGKEHQSNGVVVWYPDPQADRGWGSQGFAFEGDAIATVSGGHVEGCAKLPEDLKLVLDGLAQASLAEAKTEAQRSDAQPTPRRS